jgi:hypothetical protein
MRADSEVLNSTTVLAMAQPKTVPPSYIKEIQALINSLPMLGCVASVKWTFTRGTMDIGISMLVVVMEVCKGLVIRMMRIGRALMEGRESMLVIAWCAIRIYVDPTRS